MPKNAPTIGELFDLPERVNPSDFVLKLSEGVSDAAGTVRSYVVTPQLAACFDQALTIIQGAVTSKHSRASYLHGSFGAGKSHFMAVLYLLLQGNQQARSIPELAEVVHKHSKWTSGRQYLLVPFHMIGADSVESAVLGGYVEHVAKQHPDKPPAGLYKSDSLIANAKQLRTQMGDASFFAALNASGAGGGEGWGELESDWDGDRFERACEASPTSDDRVQLVSALAGSVLTSAQQTAGFVSFDDGLSIMSRHAKSLGYDAIILFLDELILWLASRAASVDFVTKEAPKLVKLVEAGISDRPTPIVSFVARQRDLRTVLGEQALGAEVKNFEDALNYFEARFDKVTLEDRNLPVIAQKRLLKPKDASAKELLDQSFESVKKLTESVKEILLTQDGDLDQFRQVYPFSLALVKTLVGVSTALQRERTALKIMVQLLVNQRDSLHLGEIMPVGDLFAVMRDGVDAFSSEMREHFDNARKLWEEKLCPLVEEAAGVKQEEVKTLPAADPRARRFRENERIIGTLVLSALTPELETLKALTPRKLAALNHGSIQVAIPGTEAAQVWRRVQTWASQVGEIKINGDGVDAVVSLQLTGVDTSSIIQDASHEDNHGNRIRLLKQLLSEELGVELEDTVYLEHKFTWKATTRYAELRFANVWETDDQTLKPSGDSWQIVIDFPFDREHHTPQDDLDRLAKFRSQNQGQAVKTLVWLPAFLSLETKRSLGRYVVLDFLLANDQRLKEHSTQLSAVDRAEARTLLDNQRSQLKERLRRALRQAYGVNTPEPGFLDETHQLEPNQQFQSLEASLKLKPPTASSMQDALTGILSQALEHEFPGHPDFREEAKLTDRILKLAFEKISEALASADGRILIDKESRRPLRAVLEPLELAHVGDQWLYVERHWADHFDKFEAQHQRSVTVRDLRRWIDEPKAKGLPRSLQDLVINTYVLQSNRLLLIHELSLEPGKAPLQDETVLEQQELPTQATWDLAKEHAGKVFGVPVSPLASAQNMARLFEGVKEVSDEHRRGVDSYGKKLRSILEKLGIADPKPNRLTTAESVEQTLDAIEGARRPIEVVGALESMPTATSLTAMGVSLKQASVLFSALSHLNLLLFEGLEKIHEEPKASAARGLLENLREALRSDEYEAELTKALPDLEKRATELVVERAPERLVPTPPEETKAGTKRVVVSRGSQRVRGASEFKQIVKKIEESVDETVDVTITWEISREEPE